MPNSNTLSCLQHHLLAAVHQDIMPVALMDTTDPCSVLQLKTCALLS